MADRRGLLSPIDVQGLLAARSQGLLGSMPTGEMRAHVPSLRDRIGNMVFDAATAMGLRQSAQRMRQDAGVAMDFVPGLGDAVGAEDAGRAFGAGRYGDAALGASLAAVGAMPVVGDAVAGAAKKGIRAFHGSPHSFDKFDMSKIGTGEGAQAYGHGLYFAESEGVAKSYKDALSNRKYMDGDGASPLKTAWSIVSGSPERAAMSTNDLLPFVKKAWPHVSDKDIREAIDEAKAAFQPGSMYEVNINADPDDFLDWDKPLFDQEPKVKDTLRGLGLNTEEGGRWSVSQTKSGKWTVRNVWGEPAGTFSSKEAAEAKAAEGTRRHNTGGGGFAYTRLGGNPAYGDTGEASAKLRQAGIPGIKYLDQGSRAAGVGSRNFVVFDDALIEIVRKYGIPAALGAGIITQEMAEQMQAQGLGT